MKTEKINMDEERFQEFIHEIIPQQLFHVSSKDIDDETGARLDEVILVGLIANNPSCLKHKPLQWFIDTYLISHEDWSKEKEKLFAEIEEQFLDGEMISSEDFFASSEEELFNQIQNDERDENDKRNNDKG